MGYDTPLDILASDDSPMLRVGIGESMKLVPPSSRLSEPELGQFSISMRPRTNTRLYEN
jgi:hypothetical protein